MSERGASLGAIKVPVASWRKLRSSLWGARRGLGLATEDRAFLNSADAPANWIGRMTTSGELMRWSVNSSWSLGVVAPGPDGNMWFCARTAISPPFSGLLGRVTPDGVIDVFTLPAGDFAPESL